MEQVVHHIEIWITEDGNEFVTDFCSKFGFRRSAYRKTPYCQQWLVNADHQHLQFLITYATSSKELNIINAEHSNLLMKNDPYVTWPTVCDSDSGVLSWDRKNPSSVFNVSLIINDIHQHVDHLQKCGVTFVRPLQTISDDHGSVTLATVRSCVGNVVHTLIDRQNYRGHFLPKFIAMTTEEEMKKEKTEKGKEKTLVDKNTFFTNFDHITYAVRAGTSINVLRWYEQCFGMKRFTVNS